MKSHRTCYICDQKRQENGVRRSVTAGFICSVGACDNYIHYSCRAKNELNLLQPGETGKWRNLEKHANLWRHLHECYESTELRRSTGIVMPCSELCLRFCIAVYTDRFQLTDSNETALFNVLRRVQFAKDKDIQVFLLDKYGYSQVNVDLYRAVVPTLENIIDIKVVSSRRKTPSVSSGNVDGRNDAARQSFESSDAVPSSSCKALVPEDCLEGEDSIHGDGLNETTTAIEPPVVVQNDSMLNDINPVVDDESFNQLVEAVKRMEIEKKRGRRKMMASTLSLPPLEPPNGSRDIASSYCGNNHSFKDPPETVKRRSGSLVLQKSARLSVDFITSELSDHDAQKHSGAEECKPMIEKEELVVTTEGSCAAEDEVISTTLCHNQLPHFDAEPSAESPNSAESSRHNSTSKSITNECIPVASKEAAVGGSILLSQKSSSSTTSSSSCSKEMDTDDIDVDFSLLPQEKDDDIISSSSYSSASESSSSDDEEEDASDDVEKDALEGEEDDVDCVEEDDDETDTTDDDDNTTDDTEVVNKKPSNSAVSIDEAAAGSNAVANTKANLALKGEATTSTTKRKRKKKKKTKETETPKKKEKDIWCELCHPNNGAADHDELHNKSDQGISSSFATKKQLEPHSWRVCPQFWASVDRNQAVSLKPSRFLEVIETYAWRIYDRIALKPMEKKQLEGIAEEIRMKFQSCLSGSNSNIQFQLFGSVKSGFGTIGSDLDISMSFANGRRPGNMSWKKVYLTLLSYMRMSRRNFRKPIAILNAKIPILRFEFVSSVYCFLNSGRPYAVNVDISYLNNYAVENTRLLEAYLKLSDLVKVAGIVIKYLVKRCGVGDASEGCLSSYAYMIMLIYYMQRPELPVFPVLQQDKDFLMKSKISVGTILVGFFDYYAVEFDWEHDIVQIHDPYPVIRSQRVCAFPEEETWKRKKSALAIQDPFIRSHNVGAACCSARGFLKVMGTIRNARQAFGTVPSPDMVKQISNWGFPKLDDFFIDRIRIKATQPEGRTLSYLDEIMEKRRQARLQRTKDRQREIQEQRNRRNLKAQQNRHQLLDVAQKSKKLLLNQSTEKKKSAYQNQSTKNTYNSTTTRQRKHNPFNGHNNNNNRTVLIDHDYGRPPTTTPYARRPPATMPKPKTPIQQKKTPNQQTIGKDCVDASSLDRCRPSPHTDVAAVPKKGFKKYGTPAAASSRTAQKNAKN